MVIAVWCAGCTTPRSPLPAAPSHGISPAAVRPSSASASSPAAVCFGTVPDAWRQALRAHSVPVPAGVTFVAGGTAGNSAIGQFYAPAANSIGQVDMTTGKVTTIARQPSGIGGMGAMASDPPWVVWEELDSQSNLNDWTIHAWSQARGTATAIATSRLRNGEFLAGQQPLPVLRGGVAAWAQPLPARGGYTQAAIRVDNLSAGTVATLDTGRVSSPVYAGPYLIWAKISAAGRYTLRAADAATLRPAAVPAVIAAPGPLTYLAGSPDYLAWGSGELNTLTVWPVGTSRLLRFSQGDSGHPFQFLQLAGHFVLWYTGKGSSVLDLRTGKAFDVNGSVAASPGSVVVAEQSGPSPKGGSQGPAAPARVATLPVSAMPGISGCAKARPGS